MRDACTDVKTIAKICKDFSIAPGRIAGILKFLEQRRGVATADAGEAIHKSICLLTSARFLIETWGKDMYVKQRNLCRGAKGIYKRSRASFRKAADATSAKSLHRWRRRTKDVLYVLLLLKTADSKSTRKLCSLLGREHDLVHLSETLDQETTGVQRDMLDELIGSKRKKLQGKAMKLGSKLFANKPKDFAARCIGW